MAFTLWKLYFFGAVLLHFCATKECMGEICESYTVENELHRAFACPRLTDTDNDVFCCNNSIHFTCCDNETLSVYSLNKDEHPALPRQGTVALIVVSAYGGLLVILFLVDFASHYFVVKNNKKKPEKYT